MAEALLAAQGLHRAGRLAEAESAYRRVLAMRPGHPAALHGLGLVQHQAGRHQEALALLQQAVKAVLSAPPDRPAPAAVAAEFRSNLAAVLGRLGRHAEAAAELSEAVRLRPGFAGGWCNLGVALEHCGRRAEAADAYRRAVALEPGHSAARNFLGNVLRKLGRPAEAEPQYRQAVRLRPGYAGAWNNLAAVLSGQGRLKEVIECRRKVAQLRPKSAAAHSALLSTLHYDADSTPRMLLAEAREWARKHAEGESFVPSPSSPVTGHSSPATDDSPAAPDHPSLTTDHPPLPTADSALATNHWPLTTSLRPLTTILRIGFLSSNLSGHPEGRFLRPVLANLDRAKVRTYCYSSTGRSDAVTGLLRQLCDEWREVRGLNDDQAADIIRRDGIDVLVDLTGHFGGNRLGVFARKPAPVQVTHFGYPGTSGLSCMDWRVTDAWADPRQPERGLAAGAMAYGGEAYTSERLMRVDGLAWCYDPPQEARAVGPLPALANGYVTFVCCNNPIKVTGPAVELWSQILRSVPDSRLQVLLDERGRREPAAGPKCGEGAEGGTAAGGVGGAGDGGAAGALGPDARQREGAGGGAPGGGGAPDGSDGSQGEWLRGQFARHGVEPERVRFAGRQGRGRYFDWIASADVALDPFPYNGGVTTCDTLWMGVPVVSLAGDCYWSRQGLALLNEVGLAELAARTPAEYARAAVGLATDLPRLAALRSGLRGRVRRSAVADAEGFARRLEAAWRRMWEARETGETREPSEPSGGRT